MSPIATSDQLRDALAEVCAQAWDAGIPGQDIDKLDDVFDMACQKKRTVQFIQAVLRAEELLRARSWHAHGCRCRACAARTALGLPSTSDDEEEKPE